MKQGALILADCLGFKGIWNRVDPDKLIGRLKEIESAAASRVVPKYSSSMMSFGPIRFHFRLLSDTVVLSLQYEDSGYAQGREPDDRQKNLLVSIACESAAVLANMFIDSDMPLPLRGCISFGPHLCDGNFLVGPAIDQAAEYMNIAEGAFMWLLPTAAERHSAFLSRSLILLGKSSESIMAAHQIVSEQGAEEARRMLNHPDAGSEVFIEALRLTYSQILAAPTVIPDYPMPVKGGAVLDASIVNPFIPCKNEEDRTRIKARYENFLQGDRLEIWTKRQNTLKFLEIAERAYQQFRENLGIGE